MIRTKPLVLIIEDEELISQMYTMKLNRDGYDCETAQNGKFGVDKAKKLLPDIILCDVMMPEVDGLTALEKIKKDDKTKHIPIVLLSNLAESEYVDKALELGAVSYMVKSQVTPSDVVKKVKEILFASGKHPLSE